MAVVAKQWFVQRCLETARTRFSEPGLNLAEIARAVGTSPVYLGVLFRRHVGVSFKTYVLQQRMQAAAAALKDGLAVKCVALSCGYKSASHFHRDFKRSFGTTPETWRANPAPLAVSFTGDPTAGNAYQDMMSVGAAGQAATA